MPSRFVISAVGQERDLFIPSIPACKWMYVLFTELYRDSYVECWSRGFRNSYLLVHTNRISNNKNTSQIQWPSFSFKIQSHKTNFDTICGLGELLLFVNRITYHKGTQISCMGCMYPPASFPALKNSLNLTLHKFSGFKVSTVDNLQMTKLKRMNKTILPVRAEHSWIWERSLKCHQWKFRLEYVCLSYDANILNFC